MREYTARAVTRLVGDVPPMCGDSETSSMGHRRSELHVRRFHSTEQPLYASSVSGVRRIVSMISSPHIHDALRKPWHRVQGAGMG
jgi:hypothetical protein